ncbi:DUF1758 domain-containing protein [Trichonephila clavipes]|nr:DUF1758 domain-containing protein [Trichonephila clavipes]
MQYLLQSVEPKSKAERLVLSFPATAENYPKAIDQLKERFGREDLLVQIYVRELLNLVMKNAVSGRTKTDLSALYDELEGKLRSLESLGRTREKYGDFLTPLVESCLPEEILMAWERKRNTETDAKGSRTLEHLMTFLRLKVQGEEMVQLAKSGFGTPIRRKDSPTEGVKPTELMTASALASSIKSSGKKINKCAFCEKYHPSENCFNARKMSLNAKRQLLLRAVGKKCDSSENYELNTRLVYAMRCIGKGAESARMFCGIMNLPPPPTKFSKYNHILLQATRETCEHSMAEAVREAVDENDGKRDLAVAVDGSWQKRGFSSKNGLLTVTSVDTGKVIDVEVFSKHCICPNKTKHLQNYKRNFEGCSGKMEVAGALSIFSVPSLSTMFGTQNI